MKKLSRVLWAIIPLLVALISIFVFAKYFTSNDFCASYVEALDNECNNAIKLSASASGLATAITFIPSDCGESLADQLAIIGVSFVIVISLLTFEKYLLPISGFLTFKILLPIACFIFCVAIVANNRAIKEACIKVGSRIALFSLIIFLVVPASVGVTNVVKHTYTTSIENSIQDSQQALEQIKGNTSEDVTDWASLTGAVKARLNGALSLASESVNRFIETLAVMIVTSCLLPILVLVVMVLLGLTLLRTDVILYPMLDAGKDLIAENISEESEVHSKAEERKPIGPDTDISEIRERVKALVGSKPKDK